MEGGNRDDLAILNMDEEAIENELIESRKAKENSVAGIKGVDSTATDNDFNPTDKAMQVRHSLLYTMINSKTQKWKKILYIQ